MRNDRKISRFHQAGLLTLPFVAATLQASEEPPLSEEAFWGEVPVVMSATRMSQPVIDAPVAVTVIDRRMIEASGAREIPELFRLVPGFIVGYHDGHTASVNSHLSEDRYARQMQVMVDGMSVYTTAVGGIAWSTLPFTIDDIERIEVVRGPNSASYGANSFLGVINIITRHVVEDRGTAVKTNLGDAGVRELFVRHGGAAGKLDYRVTAGYVSDDGFDERLDYKRTQMAAIRGEYTLSSRDVLSFDAGVGTGPRGVENRISNPALNPDREKVELHHHQQIKWERNLGLGESVMIQFYHIYNRNSETFQTSPIPIGIEDGFLQVAESMDVDFSRETHRYDLELQHNVALAEGVRAAWGGGVRDDQVWGGQTLMANREIHNHLKHAFMNLEWNPESPWLVNAGAMVEDYSTTGTHLSPRAGVSYRFSPGHSVRLTGSKAIRTPSMYEYAAEFGYVGPVNLYSGSALVGPSVDKPIVYYFEDVGTHAGVEKITSFELGYHGIPVPGRVELDIRIFHDDLEGLLGTINEAPVAGEPVDNLDGKVQHVVNRNFFFIRGVEFESKLAVTGNSNLYLGYAHIVNDRILKDLVTGAIAAVEQGRASPENTFSLLYMMDFDQGYSAGVGYYFMDRIQGWETGSLEHVRDPVRRLDLKVARKFDLAGKETEIALSARNVLGKYEEMEVLRPKADYPALNEVDSSAYLTVKMQLN